jgi:hypothetical protein
VLQEPKVSGAVVRNQLRAARALSSDDAVDRALASMSPEQRRELVDALAVSWCKLTTVRAFHEATAAVVGEETNAWHQRVVERAMQQTFSTIWRFFLRLTSPDALVKRAANVYAKTFDTGAMDAVVVAPGHSIASLSRWPDAPDFHLNALATGIATMLRVAGRKTVHIKWERTVDGARFHIFTNGARVTAD